MSLKAECESFVIEVESTGKSTNRPEQGNVMKEKRKATAKNWSSNSSQRLKVFAAYITKIVILISSLLNVMTFL